MPLETLRSLQAKVDAFFARVTTRHGADMSCGAGCHDCCQGGLSITGVEAADLRERLNTLPADDRARLATRARAADGSSCAALDTDGRCGIYQFRPLVCRSHGVPIRLKRGHLPVIDACPKNFVAHGPAAADPDCVLDQTTLSTVLGAIEATHARSTGRVAGERQDLRSLLSQLG